MAKEVFLWIFLVIVFLISLSGIGTTINDISCSNGEYIIYSEGWGCDKLTYAEGYFQNRTNPFILDLEANTITNLSNFTISNYNGFIFEKNGVTVTKDGLYKLSGTVTLLGNNGHEYGFALTVNNNIQLDCVAGTTASTSIRRNLGFNCLKELKKGDHLNIVTRDTTGTGTLEIYIMNFNILQLIV